MALKRVLGPATAWCVSMGVAIGSGIFRTPGEVATHLQTPGWIIAAWCLGGLIILIQGMVTAELATRFPQAGGEYVFLREAYGRFVAFFFGWAYTVFVIGAGSAVIAIAFGDFTCELFAVPVRYAGVIGALAIAAVVVVNIVGLRAGACTQNVFTCLKILALLGIVAAGFWLGSRHPTSRATDGGATHVAPWMGLLGALLPVLWSYDGTTDSVKLAEEVKDVRRAMPLAVLGSTICLTFLYTAVNLALLRVIPAPEMAGLTSVPGAAFERLLGVPGRTLMLVVAMLICLGSISSTIPATVRVMFALARDGLTFRFLARMSEGQSPGPALVVAGVVAGAFSLLRDFTVVLQMYFLASTVLYGLSYAGLIVFRRRDRGFPQNVFRCPLGPAMAAAAIAIQLTIALYIAVGEPRTALYTLALLLVLGALYLVWPKGRPADNPRSGS